MITEAEIREFESYLKFYTVFFDTYKKCFKRKYLLGRMFFCVSWIGLFLVYKYYKNLSVFLIFSAATGWLYILLSGGRWNLKSLKDDKVSYFYVFFNAIVLPFILFVYYLVLRNQHFFLASSFIILWTQLKVLDCALIFMLSVFLHYKYHSLYRIVYLFLFAFILGFLCLIGFLDIKYSFLVSIMMAIVTQMTSWDDYQALIKLLPDNLQSRVEIKVDHPDYLIYCKYCFLLFVMISFISRILIESNVINKIKLWNQFFKVFEISRGSTFFIGFETVLLSCIFYFMIIFFGRFMLILYDKFFSDRWVYLKEHGFLNLMFPFKRTSNDENDK